MIALAALSVAACASCRPNHEPSTAAPKPAARVVISSPSGRVSGVTVEVARTPEDLARGLMNRTSLPEDAGMLFVFPEMDEHSFWMKDTFIPLDMIFIGDDLTVGGIVENAEPFTLEARSAGPSRYVLEVNGGWVRRHGVGVGDRVTFENLDP